MLNLRTASLAAAMAFAPVVASSATMDSIDLESGGTYNFSDGLAFDYGDEFAAGTAAGTLTFTFVNDLAGDALISILAGTVKQVTGYFDTGLDLALGDLTDTVAPAPGKTNSTQDFEFFDVLVGSGESISFTIDHGSVLAKSSTGGRADIDFGLLVEPAPIPLPAGGLLLLSALGGVAILRRRAAA